MNKHFTKLFRLSRPGFIFRKPLMTLPKPAKLGSFAVSSSLLTLLYLRQASQFSTKTEPEVREVVALNASELQEGEMKEVQVGPDKDDVILISKYKGKFYATSARCPHLAAPLVKGVLFDEKLLCPFHSASFSVVTGIPDEGPVFQGLTTYEIREDKGKLIVKVPKELKSGADIPMVGRSKDDKRKFVILGAGPAALSAAETLRQSGYGGEIILITEDKNLPYDRTMLSKNIFHSELPKITLRNQEFFDKYGITILTGKHVSNVNAQKQTVEVDGLGGVKYDKLLVALGGKPWLPPIPGADFKNVFTLRSHDDMLKIREAAQKAKNVVIVGGSFIGMESAASFKNEFKDKINITVIEGGNAPFERVLGAQVGGALQKFHEEKGVKFHLKAKAKAIEGGNGTAQQVVLADGTKLPADIVILGTGVRPNSKPVANSVKLTEDGAVFTNHLLQSSDENIFAAGDVASVPYWYTDSRERIEHYNESIQQGQIAAYNMLGKKISHHATPFFWTRHYDKSLQYVGYAKHYDDIYIDGDLSKLDFIAYYGYKNKIVASASMGRSPAAMILNQAIQQRVVPSFEEVKSGKVTIEDIRKRVKQTTNRCKREDCMHKAPTS